MDTSRLVNLLQKWFPLLLSLIAAVVYLFTLAPSVVEIDSGELAAIQYNLGVAHPTGYPLFAILGWVLSHIPTGMSKITQMNVMAALYCAGAIFLFTRTMQVLLAKWSISRKKKTKKKSKRPAGKGKGAETKTTSSDGESTKPQLAISSIIANLIAVGAGTLFLAFGRTFWVQSTSVEVYSLHMLLINLVLYFGMEFWFDTIKTKKLPVLLGLSIGLLFANHLSAIMLVPGLLILGGAKWFRKQTDWRNLLILSGSALATVIICYGFLMIRASMDPVLNWGNPETLEFLIRHTSGQQFQIWFGESTEAFDKNFSNFFARLPEEFLFPVSVEGQKGIGMLLAFLGLAGGAIFFMMPQLTFRKDRLPMFLFVMVTAIFTVLWAANYNINDLESYFLLAYVMMAIWMTALWKWVFDYLGTKATILYAGGGLVLVLLGIQIGMNFGKVDKSDVYVYHDYTLAAMESLPENAILFSYQWDHLISPSYYFQYVEGHRKDITIIDTEILTNRRWYFDQLETNSPGLLKGVPMEVKRFKEELLVFDRDEGPDVTVLGANLKAIFAGIITANAPDRVAFVAPEVAETTLRQGSLQLPPGYTLIPDHFFYRIVNTKEYVPLEDRDFPLRIAERPAEKELQDIRVEFIREVRPKLLRDRALYDLSYGKTREAKERTERLHNEFPWFPLPTPLQNMLNQ